MPCYAASLADCRGQLSREHYFSEGALRIFTALPVVSGLAWQRPGVIAPIGIGSLASRVLCEKHNADLSRLDETLQALQRAAEQIDDFFSVDALDPGEITLELRGDLVERALLKVAFGFTYSGVFTSTPGRPPPSEVLASRRFRLIEVLFRHRPIDSIGGLFHSSDRPALPRPANVSVRCSLNDANEVIGAHIILHQMYWWIAFDDSVVESDRLRRRPNELQWENEESTRRACLSLAWPPGNEGGRV